MMHNYIHSSIISIIIFKKGTIFTQNRTELPWKGMDIPSKSDIIENWKMKGIYNHYIISSSSLSSKKKN